jgi:hypothetical protein
VYKSSFLSLTAWWDAGKARLKQYIREFSKKKAVSRRKLITSLEHIAKVTHSDQTCGVPEFVRKCSFAEECGFSCQSDS